MQEKEKHLPKWNRPNRNMRIGKSLSISRKKKTIYILHPILLNRKFWQTHTIRQLGRNGDEQIISFRLRIVRICRQAWCCRLWLSSCFSLRSRSSFCLFVSQLLWTIQVILFPIYIWTYQMAIDGLKSSANFFWIDDKLSKRMLSFY